MTVLSALKIKWYNCVMTDFGKGPSLHSTCPWLRDTAERHRRILDVTERNSVIEGLPPFDDETRQRILAQLAAISRSEQPQAPRE
jgi:hypothetical protein